MQLTTVFQISIYGFAAFSSLILALAEGAANPQGWTVPIAMLAFVFSERLKTVQLSNLWATVLGASACVLAGMEFFGNNVEGKLLAWAHLLVYLSWIILFQHKTSKQYWWICALGISQVAVGSVLTTAGLYGFLLAVYLFATIWTLTVFSVYQARQRFTNAERLGELKLETFHPGGRAGSAQDRLRATEEEAWLLRRASQARGAIQHDSQAQWIKSRFVLGTAGMTVCAMLIASAFFLFIPRIWIGSRVVVSDADVEAGRPLTGFTDVVTLGDIGEILESTEPVLEMRLFDNETGRPIDIFEYSQQLGHEEPLFRGTVLAKYRDGQWNRPRRRLPRTVSDGEPGPAMIRQQVRLQPIGTDILFAMHPVEICRLVDSEEKVSRDLVSSVLNLKFSLVRNVPKNPLDYEVYSPRPTQREQGTPNRVPLHPVAQKMFLDLPDNGQLDRMIELARSVAGVNEATGEVSKREAAERLVSYLRDSGRFAYSLDASIDDPTIDPVEDFLFNRKLGHCEYYASALALMLRAIGIPSRLISGFKGGGTNVFSGSFHVEQRHAHAWVEAYLDGTWTVLDATPTIARNESVASMANPIRSFRDLKRLMSSTWSSYAVNLTLGQQRQRIYAPFMRIANAVWDVLSGNSERLVSMVSSATRFFESPERWLSWQGGVATFVLLLLLAVSIWLCRRTFGLLRRLSATLRKRRDRMLVRVEFYERFRKLCQTHGLYRENTQTQREFASEVHRSFNQILGAAGLSAVPVDLVESFYQVRFGDERLDFRRVEEIDGQLRHLEQCLSGSSPQPVSSAS